MSISVTETNEEYFSGTLTSVERDMQSEVASSDASARLAEVESTLERTDASIVDPAEVPDAQADQQFEEPVDQASIPAEPSVEQDLADPAESVDADSECGQSGPTGQSKRSRR